MIYIGCDTWSNHPIFTNDPTNHKLSNKSKLKNYAKYLNCVEGDFSFYYIPTQKAIKNWIHQVPKHFKFVLKANRRMSFQDYNQHTSMKDRYATTMGFMQNLQPLIKHHQLLTLLYQFPKYIQCTEYNMQYLAQIRKWLPNFPISIEFRSPSWYQNKKIALYVAKYLAKLNMTEVMVDEPHNYYTGIPFIPIITNDDFVLIRLQGHNVNGWLHHSNGKNWRKLRNLYKYSNQELIDLASLIHSIHQNVKNICVIFNNNSGRDAAPNALTLKKLSRKEQ